MRHSHVFGCEMQAQGHVSGVLLRVSGVYAGAGFHACPEECTRCGRPMAVPTDCHYYTVGARIARPFVAHHSINEKYC